MHKPAPNGSVTRKRGRFGAAHRAPPTKPDLIIWPAADFDALVQAFSVHGSQPPCAWYLNDDANVAYMHRAPDSGHIALPVLYVNGEYDQVNTIKGNHYGDTMRAACSDLTITNVPAAHWLPLEKKAELVQDIRTLFKARSFDGSITSVRASSLKHLSPDTMNQHKS